MTYSALRKINHVKNADIEKYDYRSSKRVKTPMLFTSKVGIVATASIYGVFLWPYNLLSDLKFVEIKWKGLDPELYDFNKPKSYIDYLLY